MRVMSINFIRDRGCMRYGNTPWIRINEQISNSELETTLWDSTLSDALLCISARIRRSRFRTRGLSAIHLSTSHGLRTCPSSTPSCADQFAHSPVTLEPTGRLFLGMRECRCFARTKPKQTERSVHAILPRGCG